MCLKFCTLTASCRHGPNSLDEVLIFGLGCVMKITISIDRICKLSCGKWTAASAAVFEHVSFNVLMMPAKYKSICKQGKLATLRLGGSGWKQINLDHAALWKAQISWKNKCGKCILKKLLMCLIYFVSYLFHEYTWGEYRIGNIVALWNFPVVLQLTCWCKTFSFFILFCVFSV